MSKINVVIEDGLVQEVFDENGKELEYSTIDWDVRESGECPVCGTELDLDDPVCHKCGLPWEDEDYQEAIKCLENWRNWK